jgi:molybdate transport system substrate-binding protein
MKYLCLWLLLLSMVSCRPERAQPAAERSLTIAAAANLSPAFTQLGKDFEAHTGIKIIFSFAATGNLARQIENGAPYDLFAAADVKTVDKLISQGYARAESKRIYARGKLILWWRPDATEYPSSLADLRKPQFQRIAIAKPEIAPYGAAAQEALTAAGLWTQLADKVVYGESVNAAHQFAKTGNTEVAFIPFSLAAAGEKFLVVDEKLYQPIDQALCITKQCQQPARAQQFAQFIAGEQARALLIKYGYSLPSSQ